MIGDHERIRTSDPKIRTTSAFTAAQKGVRGLDCPFTMDAEVFRCYPSSLYTFLGFLRGLARDWHAASSAKRSPTLSRSTTTFRCAAPNCSTRNLVLYPAELRGHFSHYFNDLSEFLKLENSLKTH